MCESEKMKLLTYESFVRKVVTLSALLGVVLFLIYGFTIKSSDNIDSIKLETQQTSRMIFEVLYTAMQKGWGQEEIDHVISRINSENRELKITVMRGTLVEELFGRRVGAEMKVPRIDTDTIELTEDGDVRYLYPLVFQQDCLACHTNAKVQDHAGVLELVFPISNIKLSSKFVFQMFLIIFIITLVSVFTVLYYSVKKQFIMPLKTFVAEVDSIVSHNDLKNNVSVQSNIQELNHLESVFNNLTSQLAESYACLRESAHVDKLTAAFNRHRLQEVLESGQLWTGTTAVVLFDLDRFKQVNDRYGHSAGDRLLQRFAEVLRENSKGKDLLFRLGGDEFLLLMPETKASEAKGVIVQFLQKLKEVPLDLEGEQVVIEVSYGIAETQRLTDAFETVLKEADARMFENKRERKAQR